MDCHCRPPYLEALRAATRMLRGEFVAMVGGLVAASALPVRGAVASPADTILINGRFRTMAPRQRTAQAVAIAAGRFVAIGSKSEVMAFRGPTYG